MIVLAVKIRAKADKTDTVRGMLQGFVPQAQAEKGCVQYELFESRDDKGLFFFFEKWADETAYQTHRQVPYLVALRERASELLERPNEVLFLNPA